MRFFILNIFLNYLAILEPKGNSVDRLTMNRINTIKYLHYDILSSPLIARYLDISLGNSCDSSKSSNALNLRYSSIFPLTSSFLANDLSIQSFVYECGLCPSSI